MKINKNLANAIFDILVEVCGACEDCRGDFVFQMIETKEHWPCQEYRFQGNLGFGGKFYNDRGLRVDCYPEDLNPERAGAIAIATSRIKALTNDAS